MQKNSATYFTNYNHIDVSTLDLYYASKHIEQGNPNSIINISSAKNYDFICGNCDQYVLFDVNYAYVITLDIIRKNDFIKIMTKKVPKELATMIFEFVDLKG